MTVLGQWCKESAMFWRLCPHCGLKHCCEPTDTEKELLGISNQGREQRADEGRPPKRRSRALAKAKATVVSKKSARKASTKAKV